MSDGLDPMQPLSADEKRRLLRELLRKGTGASVFPVSAGQRALWVAHQLDPVSAAYNVMSRWHVRSVLDVEAFRSAFQGVIDRHAVLRTTYEASAAGEPVQRVHERAPAAFVHTIAAGWSEASLDEHLHRAASVPFDLGSGPVCRAELCTRAADDHVLLFTCHHIAYDHWSLSRLMGDWAALYEAAVAGRPPELPRLTATYADYARWQRELLGSARGEPLRAFWDRQLAGDLPVLDLPTDRPRPPVQTFAGRSYRHALEPGLVDRIGTFARSVGVTPYVVVLSAFVAWLHRYSRQDDLIVGTPMSGRTRPEFAEVAGYFVNPVVIRTPVSRELSFARLVARVRERVLEAIDHADLPFPALVERLQPARDQSRSPVFQAAFTWDKVSRPPARAGLALEFETGTQLGSNFDLDLIILDEGTSIGAVWRYSTDLFDEDTLARMAAHFVRVLDAGVDAPATRLVDLPLTSDEERQQLLRAWNPPHRAEAPVRASLIERFEAQADRTPGAPAVSGEGGVVGYRALDERANRLARLLRERGVRPGDRVGLVTERSVRLVVGLLGILKAGAAYVPADPAYPRDRVAYMFEDARVSAVVGDSSLWTEGNGLPAVLFDRDEAALDAQPDERLPIAAPTGSPAYVIYTSGSTGRPKGVEVTHQQVVRLFESTDRWFGFDGRDVWTLFHSAAFDFSVWELWGALLYGGRLVVVPFWVSRSPDAFRQLLAEEGVTVLNQTPSAFRQLVEADAQAQGAALALRSVVFGGEALDVRTLRPWVERYGADVPRLVNMYGITETTVHVTYRALTAADVLGGARSVIGGPIPDLAVYVLDERMEPAPVGVRGELFVGGAGVANGYLGQPRLTADRFVPDPYGAVPGGRLYRSGDLVRRLPDGDLEYLGRLDQQVKVRGFRIELGEIEAAVAGHDAVQDAVVVADSGRLVAYVVPRADCAGPVRRLAAWERAGRLGDRRWYDLPNGMAVVHLNRNETDFLYEEIFGAGRYLRHGVALRPGACVFDVGANVGMFSLFVAQQCPDVRIVAFEPIPPVADLLALNAELHGLDAEVVRCGVGAEAGTATFTYYPNVSIFSGRHADVTAERSVVEAFLRNQAAEGTSTELLDELLGDRLKSESVTCPLTTVSAVMRERGVAKIDLLKIDVEKSELAVLEGILPADWPRIEQVIVEVHDEGGRLAAVRALLDRQGFSVAVDQDASLAGTGLHNVYAVRASVPDACGGTPRPGWASPTRLTADLREHVGRVLPEYMVPAEFVLLDALPLTPNGKLDRRALPESVPSRIEAIAPRTEMERQVAGIWCEVLGRSAVGVHDDFFALGGHSLLATKVVSRVRQATGVALPLRSLFDGPTVEALALAIVSQQAADADPDEIRQALAEIEGLT